MVRIVLYTGFAVALGGAVTVGQGAFGQTATNKPPTDSAMIFTLADLQSKMKRDQTGRLLEGLDLFSLNLLHRTAEPATVHGNVVDLYIVQEGSATLETGGTILDPKPANRPGDQTGSGISGGKTQVIKKGDVVFIPPGVVHRFVGGDIWYLNVHFPGKKNGG